jgi:hypothetical protein
VRNLLVGFWFGEDFESRVRPLVPPGVSGEMDQVVQRQEYGPEVPDLSPDDVVSR